MLSSFNNLFAQRLLYLSLDLNISQQVTPIEGTTNIESRREKAEQSLAPQGTFVAALITLGACDNAERARFEIEHDGSGSRICRPRPDPDGALARAAEDALRGHEAAMVAWIESMQPQGRAEWLKGIGRQG